jgi:hypothetical protein
MPRKRNDQQAFISPDESFLQNLWPLSYDNRDNSRFTENLKSLSAFQNRPQPQHTICIAIHRVFSDNCQLSLPVSSLTVDHSSDYPHMACSGGREEMHNKLSDKTRTLYSRGAQIPCTKSPGQLSFFSVAPNICGSSVCNLLHITLLASTISQQLLEFWNIFGPLLYMQAGQTHRRFTNTSL